MSMITLSQKAVNKFSIIQEEGIFACTVTSVGEGRPSTTGSDATVFDIKADCIEGKNNGVEIPIWVNTNMQGDLADFYAACHNMTRAELMVQENIDIEMSNCEGKTLLVQLNIGSNPKNGRPQTEARASFPVKSRE